MAVLKSYDVNRKKDEQPSWRGGVAGVGLSESSASQGILNRIYQYLSLEGVTIGTRVWIAKRSYQMRGWWWFLKLKNRSNWHIACMFDSEIVWFCELYGCFRSIFGQDPTRKNSFGCIAHNLIYYSGETSQ
jgi:hypothetical protein